MCTSQILKALHLLSVGVKNKCFTSLGYLGEASCSEVSCACVAISL